MPILALLLCMNFLFFQFQLHWKICFWIFILNEFGNFWVQKMNLALKSYTINSSVQFTDHPSMDYPQSVSLLLRLLLFFLPPPFFFPFSSELLDLSSSSSFFLSFFPGLPFGRCPSPDWFWSVLPPLPNWLAISSATTRGTKSFTLVMLEDEEEEDEVEEVLVVMEVMFGGGGWIPRVWLLRWSCNCCCCCCCWQPQQSQQSQHPQPQPQQSPQQPPQPHWAREGIMKVVEKDIKRSRKDGADGGWRARDLIKWKTHTWDTIIIFYQRCFGFGHYILGPNCSLILDFSDLSFLIFIAYKIHINRLIEIER